jgi:signal transduction histidine kinase
MRFIRNREIGIFLIVIFIIGAAGTAGVMLVSFSAGIIAGAAALLLILAAVLFARWRYLQISRLNSYLKMINSGEYELDVRDYTEGELSILKSELYKVTVMLRQQNETLEREKTKLADALSDISHQLKTPLTSMFMMTDLLCDAGLSEEKRSEFTDRMRIQLERLQWLVSSLLKLSKLDAKITKLSPRLVSARSLLEKACSPLLIPAELKNQTLSVSDNGVLLCCDENWTAEAILNILKNCVEHTPRYGDISITCTDNPLFCEIKITDSGPGIDDNDLPHIWGRFYRGKNASDDSVGIGLSMAAAIIKEQGGSVDAKNIAPSGSVFMVRFPK